jgi:hypothetical protein
MVGNEKNLNSPDISNIGIACILNSLARCESTINNLSILGFEPPNFSTLSNEPSMNQRRIIARMNHPSITSTPSFLSQLLKNRQETITSIVFYILIAVLADFTITNGKNFIYILLSATIFAGVSLLIGITITDWVHKKHISYIINQFHRGNIVLLVDVQSNELLNKAIQTLQSCGIKHNLYKNSTS